LLPTLETDHDLYLNDGNISLPGEQRFELGERLLVEAIPVFREYYKEDNRAIYSNICRLAYAQIKQGKLTDAAPNIQTCRKARTALPEDHANSIKADIVLVETALARL
jgi:hypothetical protein